jgi:hypothetical protein
METESNYRFCHVFVIRDFKKLKEQEIDTFIGVVLWEWKRKELFGSLTPTRELCDKYIMKKNLF